MLSAAERQLLVDQALALIEHVYVHLPLKRAMHAVDPLQRLRLLKRHATGLSDPAFHAELISIFTCLRDLHTTYVLPELPELDDVPWVPEPPLEALLVPSLTGDPVSLPQPPSA